MDFKLPELGEGVHEGELVSWKVKEGDSVKHDQPLCEIMTDKATIEIPSAFDGKVAKIHAKEGSTVKVGQLMLSFEGSMHTAQGASAGGAHAGASSSVESKNSIGIATPGGSASAGLSASALAAGSGHVAAAPSTRKFAREMGVNLASVAGSGPAGRVMRSDVERMVSGSGGANMSASAGAAMMRTSVPSRTRAPLPAGGEQRVPFKGLRKKISEKMRLSKDKAAHFTYVEEADATQLVQLREQAKAIGAQQGVKVTYLPFIMKAMVAALRQYPILNSSLDEEKGELVYKHYYNIGLSIQTEDGLTAPVVKDVEHKSILELAREIQELVDRARNKKLTLEDLQGGTMTLTNAGSIGGLFATPVINYPEVAILGFNKIFKKPVVKTINGVDKVVIRNWTYFSISLDHRVVDGAIGAEFMNLFIKYIENPSLLLLESF